MLEVGDGEGVTDGTGVYVEDGVEVTDRKGAELPHALIEK